MLLRDEIRDLGLVQTDDGSPVSQINFDVTSYNLRLGKEYCLIGKDNKKQKILDCSLGTGIIRLPPFACALVSTEEVVRLPAGIAGRWGLKIRPSMSGLVFQAGPQIEPGSHSRLFGLLFNLSSTERSLHYLQSLWSIDFERLPEEVPSPLPARSTLRMRDFTQEGLPTGSVSEIYEGYQKLQRDIRSRRDIVMGLLITLVTVALSISIPIVVSGLYSNRAETSRQEQETKDRVGVLESRLAELQSSLDAAVPSAPNGLNSPTVTPTPSPTP